MLDNDKDTDSTTKANNIERDKDVYGYWMPRMRSIAAMASGICITPIGETTNDDVPIERAQVQKLR